MSEITIMLAGIIGGVLFKDYYIHIFLTKQAPRLIWSRIRKNLPREHHREAYKAFLSDYRQNNSLIIKSHLIVITLVTLRKHDDSDPPHKSC